MTQVRPLTPGSFEILPTVCTAEMPPSGYHRHVVPPLTVVLQILQVLKAASAGRAGVEPAGRRRWVGFTYMEPQVYFGLKSAVADSAGVFRNEV